MVKRILVSTLVMIIALVLGGCPQPGADKPGAAPVQAAAPGWPADANLIRVVVSIPPQKEMLEKIGGPRVHVISLLSAQDDFANTTAIDASRQKLLDEANVFFTIGAGCEQSLTVPQKVKVVDMRDEIRLKTYASHTRFLNGSSKSDKDPFFWMSPALLVKSLSMPFQTLCDLSAADKDLFSQNYTRLTRALNALEGDINRTAVGANGAEIYTDYMALGYFCDDFSFKQTLFQPEQGRTLNDLARSAIQDKVHTIFFGPYLPKEIDGKLADLIKGTVAPLNPLADNYFDNLMAIANAIREGSAKQ